MHPIRRHRAFVLLCVASSAWLARAGSAGPAQAEVPYDVYVTSERDLVESISTTRRIDEDDIEQESARTLDEALVHESSIVVRTGGGGVPRVDLRGLRTRHVLLLVDGVPFRSTEDGQFDPALIPTQIIENVDVTYSNSSVLYGDGPIAGVLQVRTRSGASGMQGRVAAEAREGDQVLGEWSAGGAARGVDGYVAGRFFDSDGYRLSDDFDATSLEGRQLRTNAERGQGNAFVKLGWTPSESARLGLLFDYRRAEFEVPSNVVDDPDDRFASRARFERVEDLEGFSTQLSAQLQPEGPLSLRSWAYVNRQREDRRRYDDMSFDSITRNGSFSREDTVLVTGGAVHGRVDLGRFGALRLAGNGRFENFQADGFERVRMGGGGGGGGGGVTISRRIDEDRDLGAGSLGIEYEWQPVEQAGLVLGYGHAFLGAERGVSDDGSLFFAGAFTDLPTGTRLRGSVARKLRFPSIRQLYDVEGGSVDLESEHCWCFEAGAEQRLPFASRLGITFFQLELRDFIERNDDTRLFENRQRLRIRGVEVEAISRPVAPLFLRLAYTFLDARDRSDDSPFDELENRPRHKLDAELRYVLPSKTTLRAAVGFVADNFAYARQAPFDELDTGDYALVDLRVTQALWSDRARLYVGVDNVGDVDSEINFGFPQPGRTVFGGAELRFF